MHITRSTLNITIFKNKSFFFSVPICFFSKRTVFEEEKATCSLLIHVIVAHFTLHLHLNVKKRSYEKQVELSNTFTLLG